VFPVAEVVDWHGVLQVLWVSTVSGIAVTAVYSIAIVGGTRAADFSRNGRRAGAFLMASLCLIALAVFAGAVVFGIVVMTQK
jgi:purine-cytosine permease-like protein